MKIVTITLMRKGSKRFPGKNIAQLGDKPLYRWTVDFAMSLGYPYYLAHDYDELEVPEGVNVIKRRENYTGDVHQTNEEIRSFGLDADIYILLQVTSPVRITGNIFESVTLLETHPEYLIAFGAMPVKPAFYHWPNGYEVNFEQKNRTDNGGFKHPFYRETGSFYVFHRECLYNKHLLDCNPDAKAIIADPFGIDIDSPEDLKEAEWALAKLGY